MPFRSPEDIWETALGSLEVQVSSTAFETWLRHTSGVAFDGEEFVVGAPNAFVAEWLQRRMRSLLERTLTEVLKHPVRVVIHTGAGSPVPTASVPAHTESDAVRPLPPLGHSPNPRFTFDTFVVGETSRLAHAAARAVADNPGGLYNPFFVYGPPGLGKTHLLHAVAHSAQARGKATLLTTAEGFVNDFVGTLREGRADEFRARYRSVEMLIIDDLQFICGKGQSEESLFHTCNTLLGDGKQIVLASDLAPAELPLAHPRLASRFQAGLVVDLKPPDYQTRLAILAAKTGDLPAPVPQEVLAFLASRRCINVRQLEGELTKTVALSTLTGQPLTLTLATQAVAVDAPAAARSPSATAILHATASHFHLTPGDLTGKSRERTVVRGRHMVMYLLRTHTDASLEQIGRLLGGRDHTTVLHGVERISQLLASDHSLREAEEVILHSASSPRIQA